MVIKNMKVNLKIINMKEKELNIMKMEIKDMKEILKMIKGMENEQYI